MSRESCITLVLRDAANREERAEVGRVLGGHAPPFDWERDGDDTYLVFVDAPHNPRNAEKTVMRALRKAGLVDALRIPFSLSTWDESRMRYVMRGEEPGPVVAPDEIRWAVDVCPVTVFEWRHVREELERRQRTVIGESQEAVEVGARDEDDASKLAESLEVLAFVRKASPRPLSRLQRWLVREHLLGNYASGAGPWS